ncbi:hypothetical protein K0A96_01140 [Patescibacteria group bacterium]|nr:hypothetical protein [Patescibacteria group bacterium]
MNKENIKSKPSLSWDRHDYQIMGDEPPECLNFDRTEGENMTQEEVEDWIREEVQCLSVFKEQYPNKFEDQFSYFLLDLEYLYSLGKIKKEDYEKLTDEGTFNFGR